MEKPERELQVTKEELQRIEKAMKNEEFRKMFTEYAQEIANPENRKKYEDEIAQLEAERGIDVKFINPQDGFVVKTSIKSEGGMKAFVNICQSEAISKATCQASSKTVDDKSVKGQQWSIPYSLNPPREDTDKAGKKCKVFDVIFHTKTYQMGQEHSRFKQLIINTAFDGLEKNWNVILDRKNLKYPKLRFKGPKTSTVIRTSNDKGVKASGTGIQVGKKTLPYPYKDKKPDIDERISENSDQDEPSSTNHSVTPKYSIVHRGHLDLQNFTNARDCRVSTRPQELVVNIDLPLCETSSGVDLDIFEKQLILDCSDPIYHLDVSLPYPVKEDKGRAQFDKSKRQLTVTLPVIPVVIPNGFADSGTIENKENGLVTEIVNDNDCDLQDVINDIDDSRDDLNFLNSTSSDIKNGTDNAKPKSVAVFKMPSYSFHQNKKTVTFVLHVSNVALETVSLGFTANKCCVNFPSTSKTSTEFDHPGYSLCIEFPKECLIDAERSSVDLNETNVVLVLYKQENCVGIWKSFMIGSDEHSLEKKIFLTEETLHESLDGIKDHWAHKQPITVSHRIDSSCEEETVIQLDVQREISKHSEDMGNILTSAEDVCSEEINHDISTKEDITNGIKKDWKDTDTKDDIVIVNYEDLNEVEVLENNYDEEDEGLTQEPLRLSTVQEIDAANTDKTGAAAGDSEMQRARAIKCRKNRRRRRRSTGSHESSSFSEEEEGLTRRGKTRGKHARHPRKSRSLSFGSSAESHDDVDADGHRCVRFNPVPEVRVFSNKADKRKWKELRKQQSLNGSTECENTHAQSMDKMCVKLKSSLKESRSSDKEILNISSDDGNTVQAENSAKKVISDDIDNDDDNQVDSIHFDVDDNQNNDDDNSSVKEKPTLTNPLIFDLDD